MVQRGYCYLGAIQQLWSISDQSQFALRICSQSFRSISVCFEKVFTLVYINLTHSRVHNRAFTFRSLFRLRWIWDRSKNWPPWPACVNAVPQNHGSSKQASRATAVNKPQLNFSVKNKLQNGLRIGYLMPILLIKRLRGNCIECFEINLEERQCHGR